MEDLLQAYCNAHTSPISKTLYELERETHLKTLAPQMISGPYQGQLLRFISMMVKPECVLEIGTFTGYGAICLSAGLQDEGKLHTIEVNEEMEYLIRKYLEKASLTEKVELHIGDARDLIPTLEASFDLVFIDAGKKDYSLYYELILDKLRPGGLILADNVLWSKKVLYPSKDEDTELIKAFNKMVQEDERVENILLPIRDGLTIARKL